MTDRKGPEQRQPNALIHETSPYLLQHAYNPVDWFPWNEGSLEKARAEHKPILLSIGYSACHWCHVMAHESFEDPETAAVMNEHFVNIKVDREERPDLDKIYQIAHQLLTQRGGGWPLTLFLTPDDRVPFFGGTYFPPEPRYGMPAFRTLLSRVADAWERDEDAIRQQNVSFKEAMGTLEPAPADSATRLDAAPLDQGVDELARTFDEVNGGFGGAPKFPHPASLEFLLQRYALRRGENEQEAAACLNMAETTLRHMAAGGIYDHLGGGFCRYAVDERWLIPHFEKMLYDNGSLLAVYAEAWRLTGDPDYRRVAAETADWILRDMQSEDGGYFSSLDADSEGEEGRFYLWTREQAEAVLSGEEYPLFARCYGLDGSPNFEGRWHLHIAVSLEEAAGALSLSLEQAEALLQSAREKLLQARNGRVWPGRDEKILTAWNGLMIRGMAVAAARLDEPAYLDSALRA
ncbi:MAG: thioredoxin domain-containing protein, partial [Gammaproteobacteria bacterium]